MILASVDTAYLQRLATTRTGMAVAGLTILLAWESLKPYFAWSGGSKRVRHGLRNMALGGLNILLIAAGFAGLWYASAAWAEKENLGFLRWLNPPTTIRWIAAFLLFDAWMYWWHRLNHRIPFLWRFHRTHHSDPRMDVTTANRFHLGEIFLSSCLRAPVIILLGLRIEELVVYEISMFAVVQFHHANVGLPHKFDRMLRAVIVTPDMHKIHHSRIQPETDSNYSSLFSWWDRIFRSFRLRNDPHEIQFGLEEFDAAAHQTFGGLLKTPIAKTGLSETSPTPVTDQINAKTR